MAVRCVLFSRNAHDSPDDARAEALAHHTNGATVARAARHAMVNA